MLPAVAFLLPVGFEAAADSGVLRNPGLPLIVMFVAGFALPLALYLRTASRGRLLVAAVYLAAEVACLRVIYSGHDDIPELGFVWYPLLLGGGLAFVRAVERDGLFRTRRR